MYYLELKPYAGYHTTKFDLSVTIIYTFLAKVRPSPMAIMLISTR